jgi:hypothetical protein
MLHLLLNNLANSTLVLGSREKKIFSQQEDINRYVLLIGHFGCSQMGNLEKKILAR